MIKDDVKETKRYLRKQTLHTILEEFDGKLMNLTKTDRRAKYRKMKQDPYSFFRGSAYLFFYDVVNIPFKYHTPRENPTWIMGDMHMDNFSAFRNEAGNIVFDVDDFDEGFLGSYLYDVLRMVVSIRLFAEGQGFSEDERDAFVAHFCKKYRKQMKKFDEGKEDPVTTEFTVDNTKSAIKKALEKLEEREATHELEKQTETDGQGNRHFDREKSKLKSVSNADWKRIHEAWPQYLDSLAEETYRGESHYEIKDIVKKKGAGIGSTGLKRFYVLIEGKHDDAHEDDIILEVKEARTPIPAYFFPYDEEFWVMHDHQGERVITTQQAMHHMSDPYLGYLHAGGSDFYVRERSPFEKDLKEKHLKKFKSVKQTVAVMAKVAAKIHARADVDLEHDILDYHSESEIMKVLKGEKEGFIEEMQLWSKFYKERVEEDFELFKDWLKEDFERR
ncbi:DUF2252 domain-containing protein [Salimicrobium halophilum]|uniref:Uncharacterized conserved protein, DUF2252 family n=1 Tax=Salimicrobium halophilum TaxID=86666 RepID=A0A1G8S6I0_9BACI|nr:DUF2252 family protein [Salimicrobium halophilum]SDJ24834.1 Uncharacterized conserved protein, DUF2252 family [Salimicrobium halophilum]